MVWSMEVGWSYGGESIHPKLRRKSRRRKLRISPRMN